MLVHVRTDVALARDLDPEERAALLATNQARDALGRPPGSTPRRVAVEVEPDRWIRQSGPVPASCGPAALDVLP